MRGAFLLCVMNKVASRAIWTEPDRVECSAKFRLVLRVTRKLSEFMISVSKLAFVSIFTSSIFFKGSAQFSFVTT